MAEENVDNQGHDDAVGLDDAGAESVLQTDQQLPPLLTQAGLHLLAFISAVALWAALDTWSLVSSLPLADFFAVVGSIIFGIVIAQTLHEWSHFAGAVFSGAEYTVKSRPAILFFDFDLEKNTRRQFLFMSWGGSIGNYLFILLVFLLVPLDSGGRDMLLATAVGMAVFVGIIELPVIRLVLQGNEPMQALTIRFASLDFFTQAILIGVVTAIVTWFLV